MTDKLTSPKQFQDLAAASTSPAELDELARKPWNFVWLEVARNPNAAPETRTELGETLAMTLAELGDYGEAAAIQRGVLQTVRKAGLTHEVRRMEGNLRLYERGQPLRSVWMGQDLQAAGK